MQQSKHRERVSLFASMEIEVQRVCERGQSADRIVVARE
jgi:hypothetical protein